MPIFCDILSMLSPYAATSPAALINAVPAAAVAPATAVTAAPATARPFDRPPPNAEPAVAPALSPAEDAAPVSCSVMLFCAPSIEGTMVTTALATSVSAIFFPLLSLACKYCS